jgi:DNA-binding NarL/FixJ family response regulator
MPDLRVLIVADDPLARAGLATLLTQQPGCSVVGQMAAHADVLTWFCGISAGSQCRDQLMRLLA